MRHNNGIGEVEIAQALSRLYISYRKKFNMVTRGGSIFLPKKAGKPLCLLDSHMLGHVRQRYAICVFAGAQSSKFLCFDVDRQDEVTVGGILSELTTIGIPRNMMHVSTSGGKGYHVDIFFDKLMYTKELGLVYKHLASRMDMEKVEFRPTYTQSIKLPLSIHGKTGNHCWYLDRETYVPIADPGYVLDIQPFSSETMREIIRELPREVPQTKRVCASLGSYMKLDENLPKDRIVQVGTRHSLMVSLATKAFYDGTNKEECSEMLLSWCEQQDQSLIESNNGQIDADIRRITNWVYGKTFQKKTRRAKQVAITLTDVQIVLRQSARSVRKLLFFIIATHKACYYGISAKRMGEIIGVSRMSVHTALNRLEEQRLIQRLHKPASALEHGRYYRPANSYRVCYENFGITGQCGIKTTIEVSADTLLSDFYEVYSGVMLEGLGLLDISDKQLEADRKKEEHRKTQTGGTVDPDTKEQEENENENGNGLSR